MHKTRRNKRIIIDGIVNKIESGKSLRSDVTLNITNREIRRELRVKRRKICVSKII